MKKIITLCALIFAINSSIFAQLSNYGFSAYSGSYTPITGTTAPLDFMDNGHTGLLPIGFPFIYDGISYTALDASSNGILKLGTAITSHTDVAFLRTLQLNAERPIIAPLWDDMMASSLNDISYQTTGSSPNKVFTIQWAQVKWPYVSSAAGIEFQVKLYEGSNKIEFIYNQLPGTNFSAGAVIGISALATGSGNYWSLQSTGTSPAVSSTSQAILSTKPAQGQVYAFQPLSACSTPLSAGATISSVNTVCSITSINLTINGATQATGLSYQWQSSTDNTNWQDIAGATAVAYTTTQSASTYYRRTITCGTANSYSTPVLVSQMATPSVNASGPTTYCDGDAPVMLTSSAASGNQWYRDGVVISGATTPNIQASVSGAYTVVVTVGSCSSSASGAINVVRKTTPATPTITPAGSTTICEGSSLILNSPSASAYQWYFNGNTISGATGNSYTATQSGSYRVIVTENGCTSQISPAVIVTTTVTSPPFITLNGNYFLSSSATGNQWYKDGAAIPGATAQTYQPVSFGVYTAKATVNNCTSVVSNALTFMPTGVNSPSFENTIVINNPVTNELLVSYKGNYAAFDILVTDLQGRIIARSVFTSNYRLNMRNNSSGVYVVRIINQRNGEHMQQMIIKD